MQRLLTCWWLLVCSSALGQLPSFKSFNPPQFATNSFIVSLKDPLVVTNITVVSNLVSQTIITTNLFTTNLYVTNIFNDITFNGRVTFNTNVTFVTNVFGATSPNLFNFSAINQSAILLTNWMVGNMAAGMSDILTIPDGYRFACSALVSATTNAINNCGGWLKVAGNYYRFTTTQTPSTNNPQTGSIFGPSSTYYFEPGETVAISNGLAGANIWFTGLFFPTNLPFRSHKLLSLSATTNLIYTVPADVHAYTPSLVAQFSANGNAGLPWWYVNDSGATRTLTYHIVASGEEPSSTNQLRIGPVNNTVANSMTVGIRYSPGTKFFITSDSADATQWTHINVFENTQ